MVVLKHFYPIATLALLLALPIEAQEQREPLVFYTWEDFIDPSLIEAWEEQSGIPVKVIFYDDEGLRSLVLSRSDLAAKIDVAIVDNATMHVLQEAGHLSEIPSARYEQFWPDACTGFGRPYLWGVYGLVYRQDKMQSNISSWRDILNPKSYLKGHIGMLGQADELMTTALAGMGYPIDSTDEMYLRQAFSLLKLQSEYVTTYDYIYSFILSDPENNDLWVAPAYSGDQYGLNEIQGIDAWRFVVPEEGAIVWVDCLIIPASSIRKDEALAFIDFITRLDNSAQNSEYLWTASPYKEVTSLVSAELREDQTIYLDKDSLAKAIPFKDMKGTDILQRTRIKDALLLYYDSH